MGNATFAMLRGSAIAASAGRPPFFFSRWNFVRMRERGNAFYCFHCGGRYGFRLPKKWGIFTDKAGKPITGEEDANSNLFEHHDPIEYADAVVGNATHYRSPDEWLEKEMPPHFPYIVTIT